MLIVLNNVLDEPHREAVLSHFRSSEEARAMHWQPATVKTLAPDLSPMALLIKIAGKFFDLESMVGCEYWAHHGTRPEWHVDKDEKRYHSTGELRTPLCSIVYYADVDASGGAFVTTMERVMPATNRMIIFAAGVEHGVEPYTGTRLSVAVNPWAEKPMGYV